MLPQPQETGSYLAREEETGRLQLHLKLLLRIKFWYNFQCEEVQMKRSIIKTIFLLLTMVIAVSFIGHSKEKTVKCEWVSTALNIDGSSQDWAGEALLFEEKLQTEYAFGNDGENLFALFIFKDPEYLSSIDATGMTIWINLEGKKKKEYGINFMKMVLKPEQFIALMEKRRGPLSEEEKNEIRSQPQYFIHNARVITKDKTKGLF